MTTVHINHPNERSEEQRHAHRDRYKFELMVRRDQIIGLWAAERLGYAGEEAEQYAVTLMLTDVEHPGDEGIIRKLTVDFEHHGLLIDRREIEKQILEAEKKVEQE
jgi:hypothetical protein